MGLEDCGRKGFVSFVGHFLLLFREQSFLPVASFFCLEGLSAWPQVGTAGLTDCAADGDLKFQRQMIMLSV
jgi:hypothetical protein